MNKLPTTEEFLKNSKNIDYSKLNRPDTLLDIEPFIEADLIAFVKLHIENFAEQIKHGDQEHQDWLLNAAKEYISKIK